MSIFSHRTYQEVVRRKEAEKKALADLGRKRAAEAFRTATEAPLKAALRAKATTFRKHATQVQQGITQRSTDATAFREHATLMAKDFGTPQGHPEGNFSDFGRTLPGVAKGVRIREVRGTTDDAGTQGNYSPQTDTITLFTDNIEAKAKRMGVDARKWRDTVLRMEFAHANQQRIAPETFADPNEVHGDIYHRINEYVGGEPTPPENDVRFEDGSVQQGRPEVRLNDILSPTTDDNRIIQEWAAAHPAEASQMTPNEILESAQSGRTVQPTDIGSPEGEPVFPGIAGKVPGFRTPAELASTVGTAGLGTTGRLAVRAGQAVGGVALGSLGALGGAEVAEEVGLPREVGELGGGLAGGITGFAAGGRVGRRVGEAIEREGGVGTLAQRTLLEEQGGTKLGGLGDEAMPPTGGEPPVGGEPPPSDPFDDARTTLLASMRQQRENIASNAPLRTEERGRRLAASENAYNRALAEGKSPREAMAVKRGVQSGELPGVEGVPTALDPAGEKAILDRISDHDFGRGMGPDWERDNTRSALLNLSLGKPIQENQILSLERVLGPEFSKELRKGLRRGPEGWEWAYELAVTPKAILSSFDMSYPLRQGIMLAPGHPFEFGKAWKPMIESFASEDTAQAVNRALIEDSRLITLVDGTTITMGRARQDHGLLRTMSANLETSEEAFRSSLAERIPLLGRVVRASNRAFTTFGNKFRGDVFGTIVEKWTRQKTPITPERLQGLSDMLNRFSGRGTLKDSRLTQILQATWWAPQTRVAPVEAAAQLFNRDGAVRAEAWRNMIAFMGTGATILGAAKMGGLNVTVDPRDTDFGKVVTGKTHINIWGPSQVLVRTIARVATGQRHDPTLGVLPTDKLSEALRYFRSGLAPEWSAVWDAVSRENYLGQPVNFDFKTLKRELPQRILPLALQDMYEAIKEEGVTGGLLAAGTIFGETSSTYPPSARAQLREIPKFSDLTPRQIYDIGNSRRGFVFDVNNERGRIREVYSADVPFKVVAENWGKEQGVDPIIINSAIALQSDKVQREAINPAWLQFVVENEKQLREEGMFGKGDEEDVPNWIIDAINASKGMLVPQ